MAGNVREWCADWYGKNYYNFSPERNSKGPSYGTQRVLRGGSWFDLPNDQHRADHTGAIRPSATNSLDFAVFRMFVKR
ncbi:MAG: formylglycine-generating enzyme family protein [candidate division KSB1 bacterium]|nr:formylglycine-generating enzyme family protein [candidate division KSB1 bacterium]MDZ7368589.1 formylglycine-generating enzyme family protein [candidate division KSB1 bacterium]MDZ7406374.1 formylglycine-generating enzyme family protein [candidate division KSB1 bacterium]